jgi:hypothetical protein
MNDQSNKQDEQWLEALAGRPDAQADKDLNREAGALRRALEVNRQLLEDKVPAVDEAHLQQLMFRLRREGLTGGAKTSASTHWQQLAARVSLRGLASVEAIARKPATWAFAASLIFAIGFALRGPYFGPKNDDTMLLRGGGDVTFIIDEKAEQKLSELVTGLNGIKAEFTQEQESYGKTLLKIKSTNEVLAFLAEKRIEPRVVDGYISIIVTPPKVQTK